MPGVQSDVSEAKAEAIILTKHLQRLPHILCVMVFNFYTECNNIYPISDVLVLCCIVHNYIIYLYIYLCNIGCTMYAVQSTPYSTVLPYGTSYIVRRIMYTILRVAYINVLFFVIPSFRESINIIK